MKMSDYAGQSRELGCLALKIATKAGSAADRRLVIGRTHIICQSRELAVRARVGRTVKMWPEIVAETRNGDELVRQPNARKTVARRSVILTPHS